jgi:hypothetical protein
MANAIEVEQQEIWRDRLPGVAPGFRREGGKTDMTEAAVFALGIAQIDGDILQELTR